MLLAGEPRRWVLTVRDLPAEMASGTWRSRWRPVKQFVMGWNDVPEARVGLLDGEPTGEYPFDLAVIAVTVAGLCERDGVPEPHWVSQHRWRGGPHLAVGWEVDSPWSRRQMAEAPAVCARFNVYYDHSWLEAATATKFPPPSVRAAQQKRMLALIANE